MVKRGVVLYTLAFIFWVVLNGKLTLEICLTGIVLVAAMAILLKGLHSYAPSTELRFLKKTPLIVAYIFVLTWEVIKANIAVMGLILKGNKSIEPTIVSFTCPLKSDFGRYLLANSITLTPGTITVDVQGDTFVVHCLRRSMLDFSADGTFCRWISRIEA